MEIHYKTNKLRKSVADLSAIKRNYGTMAKAINQRLNELMHVACLYEMRDLSHTNCHELQHDRKGQFAVNVSGNHRIVFVPANDPVPYRQDGSLDWSAITEITILEIAVDYH